MRHEELAAIVASHVAAATIQGRLPTPSEHEAIQAAANCSIAEILDRGEFIEALEPPERPLVDRLQIQLRDLEPAGDSRAITIRADLRRDIAEAADELVRLQRIEQVFVTAMEAAGITPTHPFDIAVAEPTGQPGVYRQINTPDPEALAGKIGYPVCSPCTEHRHLDCISGLDKRCSCTTCFPTGTELPRSGGESQPVLCTACTTGFHENCYAGEGVHCDCDCAVTSGS